MTGSCVGGRCDGESHGRGVRGFVEVVKEAAGFLEGIAVVLVVPAGMRQFLAERVFTIEKTCCGQ